jgi:Repeat of unknown function (DUF5648)
MDELTPLTAPKVNLLKPGASLPETPPPRAPVPVTPVKPQAPVPAAPTPPLAPPPPHPAAVRPHEGTPHTEDLPHAARSPIPWLIIGLAIVMLVPWGLFYLLSLNAKQEITSLRSSLKQTQDQVTQLKQSAAADRLSQSTPKPVYRLYNTKTKSYFYTTNQAEIDSAVQAGYQNQGAVFNVY